MEEISKMREIEGIELFKERLDGIDAKKLTDEDLNSINGGGRDYTQQEIDTIMGWKNDALADNLSDNQRAWVISADVNKMASLGIAASFCGSWTGGLKSMGIY